MSETASAIVPGPGAAAERPAERPAAGAGVLTAGDLRALVRSGAVTADRDVAPAQTQPASIDLRLGPVAYRVRTSFLPQDGTGVREKIARYGMHEIDLSRGAVLERHCLYVVPLMERLRLAKAVRGVTNPKSSTGRLDVFTRVITDGAAGFDVVPPGYTGELYAEISPKTFSILVHEGTRLSQLRLRRGSPELSEKAMRETQARTPLVHDERAADTIEANTVAVSVDLAGEGRGAPIGYRARHHTDVIDLDRVGHYAPEDYWEPIHARGGDGLILDPGEFYILASKERVTVPPELCAEMVAYDVLNGEFRVHYAGFFDPGFGHPDGTRAVLEVRSHEVPFLLEHGQIVGRLAYERLTAEPDILYGTGIGSSYGSQGLALSKHFRAPR